MKLVRIIIAGSRLFNDYDFLESKLTALIINIELKDIEIVSGCAKGADTLGERFAKNHNLPVKKFPANWELGKHAGYLRNAEMAKYATHCVVFRMKMSKGATHMIEQAKKSGLNTRYYDIC